MKPALNHAHACADQLVNALVDAHKQAVTEQPFAEILLLDLIAQARTMLSRLNQMADVCPADADDIREHELKCALFNMRGKVTEQGIYEIVENHMGNVGRANLSLFDFAELVKDNVLNEVIHLLDTCWTNEQMEEVLTRITI